MFNSYFNLVLAKVLQIKENPNEPAEKYFYVHYLDFEKRMDRWIDSKNIIKNHGINSKMKEFNGVIFKFLHLNFLNFFFANLDFIIEFN